MRFERVCGFCGDLWRGGPGVHHPGLSIDLKFCGRACLKAWEAKLSFSHMEIEAIEKMLPAMGEHVVTSGIVDKPFKDCSRDEILGLFAATVKTFRKELHAICDREGIPF